MTAIHPDTFFTLAEELLVAAEHEMERSEEDLVTHLICNNSRQSLSNFLSGFLLQQNVSITHPATLASLLKQCQSLDARFELLDLSEMHCRHEIHSMSYCLDPRQVEMCIKVAQQARSIVTAETPPY